MLEHHQLPYLPDGMTKRPQAEQELFALCQECWNFEPSQRPIAQDIFGRILEIKEHEGTA